MKLLALVPLLLLAGCGPRTPATVAEYESNHPYSKRVETVYDLTSGTPVMTRAVYVDAVPSITGDGVYIATPRTDTLIVSDGKVVSFDRQDGF